MIRRWAGSLVLVLMAAASGVRSADTVGIERISADATTIRVKLTRGGETVTLWQLAPNQNGGIMPRVFEGVSDGEIVLPRFVGPDLLKGKKDRLFLKFKLLSNGGSGRGRFVEDLTALTADATPMPWPKGVKGISCPVDIEDIKTLGVKHVNTNVSLSALIDWRSKTPVETIEVDGQAIGINMKYVESLDRDIKAMTDAGINVTLVLNNHVPKTPDPDNPLIHPRTDLAGAPNHLGAIDVTDWRGQWHFRAAMEFMAKRYSDPAKTHGWVSGYIVGNELQNHWDWYNLGKMSADDVVKAYALALRFAWLSVRKHHPDLRVYVSMDHHWAQLGGKDALKTQRGDEFLEKLNAHISSEGNFPWHVAFHPYPENLFNPRFWNDKTAPFAFDAKRITFKNIEVLPAFLKQERFLYKGACRRIILSEQGLNCPDGPDGEAIQAAAYALAYFKVSHIPEIDAFMLHRHVDHRQEGGLKIGLWSAKQDGPNPCFPDKKRAIWETFRRADAADWEAAFEFAKPIVGIKDWKDALPAATIPPR